MDMVLRLLLAGAAAFIVSCSWVKPTQEGAEVRQLTAEQAANCRKAGTTHVSVLDKIGVVKRAQSRVADELATLAANSASQLGGNAIVPISEIENGSQSFAIYSCDPVDLP